MIRGRGSTYSILVEDLTSKSCHDNRCTRSLPSEIHDLARDLARYSIDAEAFVGRAPVAILTSTGSGPATTISSTLHLPAGIPGVSFYRFDALFETGELIVEQHVTEGAPLFLGAADLPPRITSMSLGPASAGRDVDRRTISFTTERPLDAPVTLDAVLVGADASWRLVNMPGPAFALPELQVDQFPDLPYFSAQDIDLHELAATTRTPCERGDTVRITAMPFVRR